MGQSAGAPTRRREPPVRLSAAIAARLPAAYAVPMRCLLRLLRTPTARRLALLLAVAAAWAWWLWGPPTPERRWSVRADEVGLFSTAFSPDGRSVVTTACPYVRDSVNGA